jgi:hypothetical protein
MSSPSDQQMSAAKKPNNDSCNSDHRHAGGAVFGTFEERQVLMNFPQPERYSSKRTGPVNESQRTKGTR